MIAEPRRLASKPFDQNPAQAQARGAVSSYHSEKPPVLPQPVLLKPPPGGPNRGACAAVRARLGLSATASGNRGAFEDARVMRTWGLDRDWLERDPKLSAKAALFEGRFVGRN